MEAELRLFSEKPTAELRFLENNFKIKAQSGKFRLIVGDSFWIHTTAQCFCFIYDLLGTKAVFSFHFPIKLLKNILHLGS